MHLPALALHLLVLASVRVEGTSVCPTPSQVDRRLSNLLSADEGPLHSARIERANDAIHLTLRDENGAVLAERQMTPRAGCPELAAVVAVVIAAWETGLREQALSLPELQAATLLPVPAPPPPRSSRVEVSAAGVVSFSGAWTGGGLLHASAAPGGSRLGSELLLSAQGARSLQVGAGRARWHRSFAGLGPIFRLIDSSFCLDLHAQGLMSMLNVGGSGFDENAATSDFEPGLLAGARASLRWGALRPTLGLAGVTWLREQEVHVGTIGDPEASPRAREKLPRFELLLSLGVALGSG